jgi:hypothetical protein
LKDFELASSCVRSSEARNHLLFSCLLKTASDSDDSERNLIILNGSAQSPSTAHHFFACLLAVCINNEWLVKKTTTIFNLLFLTPSFCS